MQIEVNQTGYIIVSPFGNDKHAKRESFNRSFGTIKAALAVVQPNDTVLIYGDDNHEYREEPIDTLEHPGKEAWDFAYKGAPLVVTKDNVKVQGIGWPKIRFTKHGNGLNITNARNFSMAGVQLAGQGYITEKGKARYYSLFLFDGINDGHRIENNIFMDSGDHLLAHLYGPRSIFNTRILNNKFYRNGNLAVGEPWHDGVAIGLGGYGNIISGNYGEDNNRFVEIESGAFGDADATAPAKRIIVTDNVCYHVWWQAIIITPIHAKQDLYTQIICSHNQLEGWGKASPMPGGGTWGQCGFLVTGGKGIILSENIITDMYDGCAFQIEAANCDISHVQVLNNQIWRCGRTGVSLTYADWIKLTAGTPNPATQNFKLHHCQARGNTIVDGKGVGVWIKGEYNQIENNLVDNADYEGLYHEGGSFNVFRHNSLTDCGGALWGDGRMAGPHRILTDLNTVEAGNDIYWVKKGVTPPPAV